MTLPAWRRMPDWQRLKADLAEAADANPAFPEERFAGRGIVICAGGARMFTCAWITIAMLRRHLGCTLPIEVWHLGPQEMGPPMRGLLEELGAEAVDAHEVAKRHPVQRLGGWELKAYAVLHARFAEVLLLDADNLPVRDPAFLFERPEYQDSGALFWPDQVRLTRDNEVWSIADIAYRDMPSFESGQMVLDKARCWSALCLTHWINQRSDAFYRILHGDKDTFLLAWLMLGQPFYLIQHAAKALYGTLCQRDPDGSVLFQHRNWAKWILYGDNPRIAGFQWEDECRSLLEELRTAWDGRVFNPPPRSDGARHIEVMLARIRDFTLTRVSSDERRIALLPDHRVRSSVALERYWYVADGDPGPELRIEGEGVPVCALRQDGDRVWRGRMRQAPGMPIELAPLVSIQKQDEPDAALLALIDRVLDIGAALPTDGEVARDVLGALRLLSAIDPAVTGYLMQDDAVWASTPERARLIRSVRTALAASGDIAAGNNWLVRATALDTHYERR
jgi:hypothetical protein